MNLEVIKYEQNWIDWLNRGDVSPADESFASNCRIYMAGAPDPTVSGEIPISDLREFWNDMVKGIAPIVMLKNSMSPEE